MPARRQHAGALPQVQRRVRHVLDHRVRQHHVERAIAEGQVHTVGQGEGEVAAVPLAAEPDAGVLEPIRGIDADDERRLFRERQWHPAAAAAGVEHPPTNRDAGALEEGDHLRAPVILEQRVVVLGSEPQVGVRLDGALVNTAHESRILDGPELSHCPRPTHPQPCPQTYR